MAPIKGVRSFNDILIETLSSKGRYRPLVQNAWRNPPPFITGRILGAIPPPIKTPPRASDFNAKFPVSAPYSSTNSLTASAHNGSSPVTPSLEMMAFLSTPLLISGTSGQGTANPWSHRKSYRWLKPMPDMMRSQLT